MDSTTGEKLCNSKRRWVSPTEIIGSEIKSKRIKVKISDKKPFVEFDNTKIDIANLHVHSKNLKKFLPKHYKKLFIFLTKVNLLSNIHA